MPDYSEELEIAITAAREAADLIQAYRAENTFNVDLKGKNDLVTDADLAAEERILGILRNAFPEDQILAEETEQEPVLPESRTWMVDPIDGTTNFAHGFPIYCVSIAMWEHQEPKAGVVLEVNRGDLFTATAGGGAFLNDEPLRVTARKDPASSMIGTGFPYNDLSILPHYIDFFEWLIHQTRGIRRPGSAAYDLCCVAAGWFDGFYEYSLSPWDVAAGSLIVMEAGGKVSDWEGGGNWLFGERVVAGNPAIHDFLLEAIQKKFPEQHLKAVRP